MHFFSGHINKNRITQVVIMKKQIVMSSEQAVSILPCEAKAKYTLLELFCHQLNMIG